MAVPLCIQHIVTRNRLVYVSDGWAIWSWDLGAGNDAKEIWRAADPPDGGELSIPCEGAPIADIAPLEKRLLLVAFRSGAIQVHGKNGRGPIWTLPSDALMHRRAQL